MRLKKSSFFGRRAALYGPRIPSALTVEIEEPLSWIAGIAAVTFAWGGFRVFNPLFYVSPSFVAILLGFVLHELAHKTVSRRYGMAAGFVAFGPGLLITFLSGLIPGFVVLAPGYVRTIYHPWASREALLYSVAAGPATNILLSLAGIILYQSLDPFSQLALYARDIAAINAYFAFFNLLPIPPLDGSKIIRDNAGLWVGMMLAALVLLIVS